MMGIVLIIVGIITFIVMKEGLEEKGCGGCLSTVLALLIIGVILFAASQRI